MEENDDELKEPSESTARGEYENEAKTFKENLLSSVSTSGSVFSTSSLDTLEPEKPRSRSGSKARDALIMPKNIRQKLDDSQIFELKEAFLLFDLNGDGCIDHKDLKGTLISLGETVDDHTVTSMLSEAPKPLDFDGFIDMLGHRTLELDTEETLVAALSRWDQENTGLISEDKIREDLMNKGDRFTKKEAYYALEQAPIVQEGNKNMIDYIEFCSQLCGLRKND